MMQHDLIEIYWHGSDDEQHVVRWCRKCGGIVVDIDVDGRTAPGAVRKMQIPTMTAESHCLKQRTGS